MSTLKMVATIFYIIDCIALVVVVLMQEGKTSGLTALRGSSDTYWSKNKGRSTEGLLVKLTRFLGAAFILLSFVLHTDWLG